ncbi:MAG TPA: FtsX-like permease family protein [Flavipsychrobacter sp.]|nr:FtsX-like permease family protein [Flavipsychrobacter sp.]
MNWKLSFRIAVTHLVTKRKQSIIAMLGVMFGISMFIIMISFMTGVNQFLEDITMDNTPHVRIYKPIEIQDRKIISDAEPVGADDWHIVMHQKPKNDMPKIKNGIQLMQTIENMPEVLGAAPQVSSQVFYNNGPVQIPGNIYGIDVRKQIAMFSLDKKMDFGELEDLLKGGDMIVMGRGLAEKMGVEIGSRVSITTPDGANLTLKVAGIFSFGIAAMDETRSYATLATVQKVLQKDPSYITDINIKMKDVNVASAFRKKLENQLPGVYVEDWETANASMLAGDKIRNILTAVVCITLLTVAGFGIYNIMNMNIINKMKDIAILKATGFQGNDITGIFLLQSLMIGIAGGLLGLLIGFFFSYLLSKAPFPAASFFRIKTFPVNFKAVHYIAGLLFGFLTTLFAGYFPSKRAAKIDPVQIIRG